jgi:hypothetical protein
VPKGPAWTGTGVLDLQAFGLGTTDAANSPEAITPPAPGSCSTSLQSFHGNISTLKGEVTQQLVAGVVAQFEYDPQLQTWAEAGPGTARERVERGVRLVLSSWAHASNGNPISRRFQQVVADMFEVGAGWYGGDDARERLADEMISDLRAEFPLDARDADEGPFDEGAFFDYTSNWGTEMAHWAANAEPLMRAVADAQYTRTQDLLAEAGVDSVVLYRGVRWDVAEDLCPEWVESEFAWAIPNREQVPSGHEACRPSGDRDVDLAPLSSWTTSGMTASRFARDYADAQTGWDCLYGVMSARVPASAVFSTPETGLGCLGENEVVVLGRPARVSARWTARRGTNETGDTYGDWDSDPW